MNGLTLTNRLACWWMIFRIALEERLAYRGDFAGDVDAPADHYASIFVGRSVRDGWQR